MGIINVTPLLGVSQMLYRTMIQRMDPSRPLTIAEYDPETPIGVYLSVFNPLGRKSSRRYLIGRIRTVFGNTDPVPVPSRFAPPAMDTETGSAMYDPHYSVQRGGSCRIVPILPIAIGKDRKHAPRTLSQAVSGTPTVYALLRRMGGSVPRRDWTGRTPSIVVYRIPVGLQRGTVRTVYGLNPEAGKAYRRGVLSTLNFADPVNRKLAESLRDKRRANRAETRRLIDSGLIRNPDLSSSGVYADRPNYYPLRDSSRNSLRSAKDRRGTADRIGKGDTLATLPPQIREILTRWSYSAARLITGGGKGEAATTVGVNAPTTNMLSVATTDAKAVNRYFAKRDRGGRSTRRQRFNDGTMHNIVANNDIAADILATSLTYIGRMLTVYRKYRQSRRYAAGYRLAAEWIDKRGRVHTFTGTWGDIVRMAMVRGRAEYGRTFTPHPATKRLNSIGSKYRHTPRMTDPKAMRDAIANAAGRYRNNPVAYAMLQEMNRASNDPADIVEYRERMDGIATILREVMQGMTERQMGQTISAAHAGKRIGNGRDQGEITKKATRAITQQMPHRQWFIFALENILNRVG